MDSKIKLVIPKKTDYISIARLTSSGIASNFNLPIEDIEDIKMSLGEASINALANPDIEEITMEFEVRDSKFFLRVSGVRKDLGDSKELELGLFIIKSLMDEVIFNDFGLEMIKYIEDDS